MASRVTFQLNDDDTLGTTIIGAGVSLSANDMGVYGAKWENDGGGLATTLTITRSGGNAAAGNGSQLSHSNNGLCSQMAQGPLTAGGSIASTFTLAAARPYRRGYVEWWRPAGGTTLSLDAEQTPAQGTAATNLTGGTNALTYTANGFAVGFFGEFNGVTYTAGSGWTASGVSAALMEYRTTSGSGSLTVNATCSSAMDYTAHGMSFKETATGGGATVVVGLGQATLTGFAAQLPKVSVPALGQATLTGFAPSILTGGGQAIVQPALGQATVTGFAPTPTLGLTLGTIHTFSLVAGATQVATVITPDLGQATLTGFAPSFFTPATFFPPLGQAILTGFAPSTTAALQLAIGRGQLILTGFAPTRAGPPNTGGGAQAISILRGKRRRGAFLHRR